MLSFRCIRSCSVPGKETLMALGFGGPLNQTAGFRFCSRSSSRHSLRIRCFFAAYRSSSSREDDFPLSAFRIFPVHFISPERCHQSSALKAGLEDVLVGYLYGKKKATEVAHLVWKQVVQQGDSVIDATCGNGYDTMAMLKMVVDKSGGGHVYGTDIQSTALENTSSFLDQSVSPAEKEHVRLFNLCHSRMEEIIPDNTFVRLVAFNLGYLPGGNKSIITTSGTTLSALNAAERILMPGGLISLVAYVGHPGGREELETVEAFASGLSVDNWVCCKFQMLNRPLAPVLVFIFKK